MFYISSRNLKSCILVLKKLYIQISSSVALSLQFCIHGKIQQIHVILKLCKAKDDEYSWYEYNILQLKLIFEIEPQ